MNLYRASSRAGVCGSISEEFRPIYGRAFTSLHRSQGWRGSFNSPLSQNAQTTVSGCLEGCKSKVVNSDCYRVSIFGNLSRKLASLTVKETLPLPCARSFCSFIHNGNPTQAENGKFSRSMDFVRGIIEETGNDRFGGSHLSQYHVEQNADIVHIKLLRNNTFVTLTDSKGFKKISASAGCLPDNQGKASRYSADATAEYVGRRARNYGVTAVVMKVSGFTHFKRKRQAIMAFKEGYSRGRGEKNPIIYIEDTTQRSHNGSAQKTPYLVVESWIRAFMPFEIVGVTRKRDAY